MSVIDELIRNTHVLDIVGDMIRVRASGVALGDLAVVENVDGEVSTAEVVGVEGEIVSLQVYTGRKGSDPDFDLAPGEAYFVKMSGTVSYVPSHY